MSSYRREKERTKKRTVLIALPRSSVIGHIQTPYTRELHAYQTNLTGGCNSIYTQFNVPNDIGQKSRAIYTFNTFIYASVSINKFMHRWPMNMTMLDMHTQAHSSIIPLTLFIVFESSARENICHSACNCNGCLFAPQYINIQLSECWWWWVSLLLLYIYKYIFVVCCV